MKKEYDYEYEERSTGLAKLVSVGLSLTYAATLVGYAGYQIVKFILPDTKNIYKIKQALSHLSIEHYRHHHSKHMKSS